MAPSYRGWTQSLRDSVCDSKEDTLTYTYYKDIVIEIRT